MVYKDIDVDYLVQTARAAGAEIMKVYSKPFDVEVKGDNSPVTEADKKANHVIHQHLSILYPDIPFLSEESAQVPYDVRKNWHHFWLIDPLDGTKEFIRKNDEFTVNIALVEDGVPVIGVVYAPALEAMYFGANGLGAYKYDGDTAQPLFLSSATHYAHQEKIVVVGSRSHLSDEVSAFVEDLKNAGKQVEFKSSGSSLKFCLVAEGVADVYPRFGPTMEWDTAAAQAIVTNAGRQVIDYKTKKPLVYNKENLLNPWFIVE